MPAALARARGAWLLALALPVGLASVPGPAAGEAAPLRGAARRSSDRIQGIWPLAEGAEGPEAQRAPRALRRQAEAPGAGPALRQALGPALAAVAGARRRPWPEAAWGLRPAHRKARSWSRPALPGGSAVR